MGEVGHEFCLLTLADNGYYYGQINEVLSRSIKCLKPHGLGKVLRKQRGELIFGYFVQGLLHGKVVYVTK